MARSLEDLLKIFRELNKKIKSDKSAERAANDCLALVKNRVINTGIDSDGQKFSDNKGRTAYSDTPLPLFFYYNKPARGNAEKKVESMQNRVGNLASYADWREENNLNVEHVNFQFTGDMWRQTDVVMSNRQTGKIATFKSKTNDETNQKIQWNEKRYEGFMNPNEAEMEIVNRIYNQDIEDFLKRNL